MTTFLNIDLGELPDEPEELYALAGVASIACGGHAGDADSMRRALAACARGGARPGAHPSYPDREGFGRRPMPMAPRALADAVRAQCAALAALGVIAFAKPHGALYHAADADDALAQAVVEGVTTALGAVTLIGPPGGALARAAANAGLVYWREGFADRGRRGDHLIPRGEPGAIITDPAEAAALARTLACETVCVHGDNPNAVAVARAVREALG